MIFQRRAALSVAISEIDKIRIFEAVTLSSHHVDNSIIIIIGAYVAASSCICFFHSITLLEKRTVTPFVFLCIEKGGWVTAFF